MFQYRIRFGDTMYGIAERFGVSINEILAVNPQIINPEVIYPGMLINIPSPDSNVYTIKPGDTLYGISQKLNTSINEILSVNPQIDNPEMIFPGMVINLPVPGPIIYTIKHGDTLNLVAARYKVTLASLYHANPGINAANLLIGMKIYIPVNAPDIFPTYNILGSSDKLTQNQQANLANWRNFILQFARNHPKEVYIHGPVSRKAVSLTFDDGPDTDITPRVLDILKQHNVKAGFFFMGGRVQLNPEVARRVYEEGHLALNHSWNHPDFRTQDLASVRNQIVRTEDRIKNIIGKRPAYVRPPYGAVDERVLPAITGTGNITVIWSIDSMDWVENIDKDTVVNNVLDNVRPGDIILLHTYPGLNVELEALPEIITGLRAKGYSILSPDELLGINPYKI